MEPGLWLTGELLSVTPGKAWVGKHDGITRQPGQVKVLVGDRVYQVDFRDMESAGQVVGDRERGDLVTVQVFARAVGDGAWLAFSGRAPSLTEA